MKKLFSITFACFFLIIGNIEAKNYKDAFVITNENDTVFGKIDLSNNRKNQEICNFLDNTGKETNYLPADIAGYYFTDENKHYLSKTVTIDSVSRNVFIEMLVMGIVNLYYYEDYDINISNTDIKPKYLTLQDYVPYFFFEKEDGQLYSIRKKPDAIKYVSENNQQAMEDNAYKGIVRYLLSDANAAVQKTDYLSFNQKSMIKIVTDYHNEVCTTGEQCIVYKNPKPDNRGDIMKISVYGGVQLSNYYWENRFSLSHQRDEWFYPYHITSNLAPVIGVEFLLANPRITNLFALQFDISASYVACNSGGFIKIPKEPYHSQGVPSGFMRNIPNFGSVSLNNHTGAMFKYPLGNFEPLVSAGISQMLLFTDANVRKLYFGFYANIGANIKLKRNAITVRFNYDNCTFIKGNNLNNGYDGMSMFSAKIGYMF